jgi:hypothetical protein
MDEVEVIRIVAGLVVIGLIVFVIWLARKPAKTVPNPYIQGGLVAVATLWIWHVSVVIPGGAEAIGYDIGALALPVLLLWFSGSRFKAALAHRGVVAPYKWMIAGICAIWGALGLLDLVQATTVHRVGAFLTWGFFWSIALVLFVTAKVQQSRNKPVQADFSPTTARRRRAAFRN